MLEAKAEAVAVANFMRPTTKPRPNVEVTKLSYIS